MRRLSRVSPYPLRRAKAHESSLALSGGSLEVRAATSIEDNTLSKIIQLVEKAHGETGKSQLFIEWFEDRYTILVLLSAFILLFGSPVLGGSISEWAVRAVVLLVATDPCALVMSTRVAIAAGIGKSGRNGVLIKGGTHLEDLGKIRAVAFDKTGTFKPSESRS